MGRKTLPGVRNGKIHKFSVGHGDQEIRVYVQTGEYEDGQLGEVFLKSDRQGSLVSGLIESFSIVTSLALQYGVPLETIAEKLRKLRFEPDGHVGGGAEGINRCTSVMDYLANWLMLRYGKGEQDENGQGGNVEPSDAGDAPHSD